MNLTILRKKIDAWADLCDAQDLASGKAWYRDAHTFAREVATRYELTLPQVVGVLACLSVQNRWDSNKRECEAMCRAQYEFNDPAACRVGSYKLQKDKAVAILSGAIADADIPATVAGRYGPKTRAFYDNILDPEHSIAVTIDRWILRGLDLEYLASSGANRYVAAYRHIAEVIRQCAIERGLLPHELQAAIWCRIQRTAEAESWEGSRPGTGLQDGVPF